uniref:Adaptin_N domain-containing protein n=1 Tax=Gongylonema pulchrum TaxID=637853 RepID=A0A183E213_9BILA
LSSIRVPMIAPIMLLAIRESESLQPELIECIDYLLGDKRTLAIADVDEWGQVVMIGLLTRYARCQFVAPSETAVDSDLTLLLSSCRPLLQSRNCAVVMAVAQLFYHCAPPAQLSIISRALVRLLRGPREVQSVVLVNIATICATNPVLGRPNFAISNNMFEPFLKSFFIRPAEPKHIKLLKLQVLTTLVSETNVQLVLRELQNMFEPFLKSFFIRPAEPKHIKLLKLQVLTTLVSETNVQLVLRELQTYVNIAEMADAAVDAIGQCAVRVNSVADSCLSGLVSLIASSNENVVSAAVVTYVNIAEMADAAVGAIGQCAVRVNSVADSCLSGLVSLIASSNENVVSAAVVVLKRSTFEPFLKNILLT